MRFDVYRLPPGEPAGFMVDVQSDFLSDLPTRMVIPLLREPKLASIFRDLNPEFEIMGSRCVLMTQELASIPKRQLANPVTSLSPRQDEITRALDLLFTGF
jgi:toxin CcdB